MVDKIAQLNDFWQGKEFLKSHKIKKIQKSYKNE